MFVIDISSTLHSAQTELHNVNSGSAKLTRPRYLHSLSRPTALLRHFYGAIVTTMITYQDAAEVLAVLGGTSSSKTMGDAAARLKAVPVWKYVQAPRLGPVALH